MGSGQQARRSGFCRQFVWCPNRMAVCKQCSKMKALRINTSKTDQFTLRDESIEDVDSFTYLGSVFAKDGGAVQDVLQRI